MMLMGGMAKKQKLSYLAYSIITVMFCLPTSVLAQETVEHTQAITSVTAQTETVEKTTVSVTQQAQAILKQQPKIEPLTFDDLEHYQTHADVAMMNEIYQVAEQAKKDATTWQETGQTTTQPLQKSMLETLQEAPIAKIDVEQLAPSTNVTELMQNIQQDSKNIVEQVATTNQILEQDDIFKDKTDLVLDDVNQGSWFQRWKRQRNLPELKKEQYIKVEVENADTLELGENIIATLETLTVESVKDFNVMLPQMRKLANQAAQAMGYYDVDFIFTPSDDYKRVSVKLKNQENVVRVQSQNVNFVGAGELVPQFQVIKVIPDLEEGDILHHGKYEETKTRINDAASNNGFFDGSWLLHDVKVSLPENTADINLKYDTGERYQLGDVQFRMSDPSKPLPIDERILREMMTWQIGDNYAQWRINLFSNYLTNSRFFNSVTVNAVTPDPIQKELDLPPDILQAIEKQKANLSTTTPVSHVANVDESQFAGVNEESKADDAQTSNDEISPQILQSETSAQTIQQEKEEDRLKQQARETKQIPVIVTLNADKPNNMEVGFGYGTDTEFRTRMQYRRAFLNRYGHSLQGNIELSKIRQAGELRYNIPYHHPINRYFTLVGGYERESDQSLGKGLELITETAIGGGDLTLKSQRYDAWQHSFGLRYRLDRLTVNGDVDIFDIPQRFLIVRTPNQQSLLASYSAYKLTANSPTNITQGLRQNYKIQLGSKHALSDANIAIVSAGLGFIYSFGTNNNHQFIGRADGSYMFTDDFISVPYNLRFFTGGDQSIRGFDYKSLSPMEDGFRVGGQAVAVGSMEYNYQVADGWRVGVFSDFGNSFDANFKNPIAYSVGLGVRWQSPVGPIRVDLASGISDPNHPIRLHFFIGSPLQ